MHPHTHTQAFVFLQDEANQIAYRQRISLRVLTAQATDRYIPRRHRWIHQTGGEVLGSSIEKPRIHSAQQEQKTLRKIIQRSNGLDCE